MYPCRVWRWVSVVQLLLGISEALSWIATLQEMGVVAHTSDLRTQLLFLVIYNYKSKQAIGLKALCEQAEMDVDWKY